MVSYKHKKYWRSPKNKEKAKEYRKKPRAIARRKELYRIKQEELSVSLQKTNKPYAERLKKLKCPKCGEIYLKENRADKKCLFCGEGK